jgi:imidazolonepropionase
LRAFLERRLGWHDPERWDKLQFVKRKPRWRAVVHASELLTGAGLRTKDGRRPVDADLGRIADGALVHEVDARGVPGRVLWVGATDDLPRQYRRSAAHLDLGGRKALIPGLVDCHTHLVFDGDRSEEFARRCGGATYEEIAASGGGISTTVRSTRAASAARLLGLARARVREAMKYGVRTIELKSGYGLDQQTEFKQLEVARRLREQFPEIAFQSTYLGAHATPPGRDRGDYVDEIVDKTLPELGRLKLADAVDVFIDRGYFTLAEGRRILERARSLGLGVKVHADELSNTESASLASELGAWSADHLLQISDRGIHSLARSGTTAVLLPGTAFYLKAAHAPARRLIDSGARVAIATDFNPGTCMTLNLPAVMTIAALYLGMTRAELFAAVTYNGACALGMQRHRGTLEPGLDAAFAVLPFRRFEEMYYRFAW